MIVCHFFWDKQDCGMYHWAVCRFPSPIHSSIKILVFHQCTIIYTEKLFLRFIHLYPCNSQWIHYQQTAKCGAHLFTLLQTTENLSPSSRISVSHFLYHTMKSYSKGRRLTHKVIFKFWLVSNIFSFHTECRVALSNVFFSPLSIENGCDLCVCN